MRLSMDGTELTRMTRDITFTYWPQLGGQLLIIVDYNGEIANNSANIGMAFESVHDKSAICI